MPDHTPIRRRRMLLILAAIATSWAAAPIAAAQPLSSPQPLDECQVLARVGKQVILSCEVLWKVNHIIEQNGGGIPPAEVERVRDRLMRQQLTAMLDMKLLYADFRSKLPEANLPQIHKNLAKPFEEERLPQLMKQLDVDDRQKLATRLKGLGASVEDIRQDYYQTMIARSWANEAVTFDKEVTHGQLLDYYRENGAEYDYPAKARWEELMARFSGFASRDAAWSAIAEMGNSAYATATTMPNPSDPAFGTIAKKKSQGFTAEQGGQHDWTTKGALAADSIDEALFALPIGQMSPIIKSEQGFHIIRVLERKTAGRKSFGEVQSEIENRIRGKRYDTAIKAKLAELRRKTQIWTVFSGTTTAQAYLDSQQSSVRR